MNKLLTAQLCAMTFQGNAKNGLQQDAFFFVDNYYQEKAGITPIVSCENAFCIAVADGIAQSNLSGFASKLAVKTVAKLWQDYQQNPNNSKILDMIAIYEKLATAPKRYYGAMTTLAMVYRKYHENQVIIKHIGDSRVYLLRNNVWQCLTKDHNVLNQLIDEQPTVYPYTYNQQGMATSLYTLTEFLTVDSDVDSNPMPTYDSQILSIQAGDCLLICTDGVHDLVESEYWQAVDDKTNLQEWLNQLKNQIYQSDGKAYDNATAILIQFSD